MRFSPQNKSGLMAECLSIGFIGCIVAAANAIHIVYVLFPELGAVAGDVLARPDGKWAKEPWKLVATPTTTAAIGIFIGQRLPYGVLTILLTMTLCIGVVFGLRSAVSPAISAGVLPIVIGVTSWMYPACIFCTLSVLTLLLLAWRSTALGKSLLAAPAKQVSEDVKVVDVLESRPKGRWWFAALVLFVAVVGFAAQITSLRFILFPPLVVMGYEMLGHSDTCPWAKAPFTFPVVCTFAALSGVEAVQWIGVNPMGAMIVMVFTFGALKLCRLRMPPALAIGLIPFVLAKPTPLYALSVCIGTVALTTWFLCYRWWLMRFDSPVLASK